MRIAIRVVVSVSLGMAILAWGGGCAIFGFVASAIPAPPVKAAYAGLAGQSVGVMVWVDRGIRIDYPTIQLDVANAIQIKLKAAQQDGKEELKGATFPVEPRSIARYQADHPEADATPIAEVAPNLNVSRLIYVEITDFQTRPEASLELYRGVVNGTLRVVAIDAAGKAKIVHEENELRVVFPKKAPVDGVPTGSDAKIYVGTLEDFTTRVAWKFFEHREDDEE